MKFNTGCPKKNLPLFAILFFLLYNLLFGQILFVTDRARKNLLDRNIFILKTFHRKWEQKRNSLNMKSILERNQFFAICDVL